MFPASRSPCGKRRAQATGNGHQHQGRSHVELRVRRQPHPIRNQRRGRVASRNSESPRRARISPRAPDRPPRLRPACAPGASGRRRARAAWPRPARHPFLTAQRPDRGGTRTARCSAPFRGAASVSQVDRSMTGMDGGCRTSPDIRESPTRRCPVLVSQNDTRSGRRPRNRPGRRHRLVEACAASRGDADGAVRRLPPVAGRVVGIDNNDASEVVCATASTRARRPPARNRPHRAPASVKSSSRGAAIAFHATPPWLITAARRAETNGAIEAAPDSSGGAWSSPRD
jgi:hypothetical protein